ncbi:MAG: hypothetical protein EXQ47_05475 [Bryobacterales bacterium]|nr:hypothetical protein [Bryobacterales bacterium]
MPRHSSFVFLLVLALVARAETLDRIAVTVGKYVISEQDLVRDIRVSAFLDGTAPGFDGTQRRKAADRLIDQYLVLQDATETHATLPPAGSATPLLTPLKARYASEAEYRAALDKAGISDAGLQTHLLTGLRMLRYTNVRFRPQMQVSEEGLRAYFEALMSQNPNAPAQSFEESRGQVEKLLTDQQTMQSLDDWLKMMRGETQILYREAVFR